MVFASFNRRVHASLVAGLIAVSASACVEDQDYLVVERAVWFTDAETCVLSDGEPSPLSMTVDVTFDSRIGMGFLVKNNTTPYENSNSGIDDSEISMESAEVRLSFSGGSFEGSSFEVTLPSQSIGSEETVPFVVEAPVEVTRTLRGMMTPGEIQTLEMEVIFKGRTYGQAGKSKLGTVESRAFTYPFDVCLGCLADCSCGDCPTADNWVGLCNYAQFASVGLPGCDPDAATDTTTGP